MADKYVPTIGGQKAGWLGSTFGQTDQLLHQIPTRSGGQQLAQLGQLGQTLYRLSNGFNAGDQNAARAAEYRNLQEQVLPQIREHYGAGLGGGSAFNRNLAGAVAASNERLNAQREGRQHELQKLQQEQLPRLYELGLQPSFESHITDQPFNPKYAPDETIASQLGSSREAGTTREALDRLRNAGYRGGEALNEQLMKEPRTLAEIATARKAPGNAGKFGQLKVAAQDIPPTALDTLRKGYQAFEKISRPTAAGTRESGAPITAPEQKAFEENRTLNQLSEKVGLPEEIRKYIRPEHIPMLEYLASRKRGRTELSEIKSADDIEKLYNFWLKNPAKRERIVDYFRQLVGKKAKQRG